MKNIKISLKELETEIKRLKDIKIEQDKKNKLIQEIEETKRAIKGEKFLLKIWNHFTGDKI